MPYSKKLQLKKEGIELDVTIDRYYLPPNTECIKVLDANHIEAALESAYQEYMPSSAPEPSNKGSLLTSKAAAMYRRARTGHGEDGQKNATEFMNGVRAVFSAARESGADVDLLEIRTLVTQHLSSGPGHYKQGSFKTLIIDALYHQYCELRGTERSDLRTQLLEEVRATRVGQAKSSAQIGLMDTPSEAYGSAALEKFAIAACEYATESKPTQTQQSSQTHQSSPRQGG